VLGAWGAPQKKGKGKAKAGSSGAGGGPSNKAAAAAAGSSGQGSSSQGSSGQGSSRPGAPPARIIGLSTEEPAVQAAEPADGAQQTEPQPARGGNTKKDKERQRKERQRQRKMEEAMEALDGAMALLARTAGARSVKAVEEAMQAASKHDGRSEPLTALVAEARGMLEQARAAEAERARVAAEAAAAAAAVEAEAEAAASEKREQLEERRAALALELQQVQTELGSGSGTPRPDEESQCVLCLDAPKDHIITPFGHQCVCGACAEKLKRVKRNPACPICREPINATFKVFVA
jgi:hypothetical protein